MSENRSGDGLFDGDNQAEHELWDTLGDVPHAEPSARLRSAFYSRLEQASSKSVHMKLQEFLGLSGGAGWITATACVLIGIGASLLAGGVGYDSDRLAALESSIAMLNRSLVLDRLENESTSKRLRGVVDAAFIAGDDAEIVRALLRRATEDRAPLVRTAAIDALGPHFRASSIRKPLLEMLRSAESPHVQLALVDLVLRNGNQEQFEQLLKLAESGALHEDVASHVRSSLERDVI